MDDKRLEAEKQVLASKLLVGDEEYKEESDGEDFPEMVPNMYVKNKILLKSGQPILENDENFKTLCYKDDMIGIRHYSNESWSPMVPLYHVYIRGKMWLEMYEQYFNSKKIF